MLLISICLFVFLCYLIDVVEQIEAIQMLQTIRMSREKQTSTGLSPLILIDVYYTLCLLYEFLGNQSLVLQTLLFMYWIGLVMHLTYTGLLHWRDASYNTQDYCIGWMHLTIH